MGRNCNNTGGRWVDGLAIFGGVDDIALAETRKEVHKFNKWIIRGINMTCEL